MIEDARHRILASALSLFAAHGYDAVSVERIRDHADVSNGSFFHAFPSKLDLAAALLVDSVEAYQAYLLDRLSTARGAREGIHAIVGGHLDWVERNQRRARFMFDQARAAWFERAREPLRQANAGFRGGLEAWRRTAVAAGELRDMPIEVVGATLVGPANLLVRTWFAAVSADAAPPWTFRDHLLRAAEAALLKDPEP